MKGKKQVTKRLENMKRGNWRNRNLKRREDWEVSKALFDGQIPLKIEKKKKTLIVTGEMKTREEFPDMKIEYKEKLWNLLP